MKRGLILDPKTGKPLGEAQRILHSHFEDYDIKVPQHVQESLDKAPDSSVMGSAVGWRDVLTPRRVLAADGAAVSATTSETIMLPDFTFAADALEVGDAFIYTLFGKWSTVVTTPGTVTFRLRWGGVGGLALATSGAFAPDPTAASTDLTYFVQWHMVCRALGSGTSGSILAFGRIDWSDYDDASATTLKGNLDMGLAPTALPAAVGVDTTTAKALSPTVQFSVATGGTTLTNMTGILESLN